MTRGVRDWSCLDRDVEFWNRTSDIQLVETVRHLFLEDKQRNPRTWAALFKILEEMQP